MKIKPACSEKTFDEEVMVIPNIIANEAIRNQARKNGVDLKSLKDGQFDWFCNFASWRVRWYYTNDAKWHSELLKQDSRPWLELWMNHWAEAFFKEGADNYISNRQTESSHLTDPEWQPGGLLATN